MPNDIFTTVTDVSCPLCKCPASVLREPSTYRPFLPNSSCESAISVALVHCHICNHGFLADNFTGSLEDYYADGPRRGNNLAFTQREITSANAILSSISSRHNQTVLEIGGGFSPFPRLLIESGKISSYLSVDPAFRHLTEHPESSLDAFTFADELPQESQFSVIVIRQVLEHVLDLPGFLAKLKSQCNVDTVVYVEVPNFSYTLRHGSWFDICFEHKHYFTQKSLVSILRRCGLHPFRDGFLNEEHDFYVIASPSQRPEVLPVKNNNISAALTPAWPKLPNHYFGYGLNSNLESILNFSGATAPKYLFDDGAAVTHTYLGAKKIEVGPFSKGKLLNLIEKYGDLPIIIFTPFSLEKIRARLPENQATGVISGSRLLKV